MCFNGFLHLLGWQLWASSYAIIRDSKVGEYGFEGRNILDSKRRTKALTIGYNKKPTKRKTMSNNALQNLQTIPGIGKSLSRDLFDLGYANVEGLKDEVPEDMYARLMVLRGKHVDRCVLYVFRCAVYYASHDQHETELLKWWSWKDL